MQAPAAAADERRAAAARRADPRLPAIVHQIWGDPAQFAGRRIHIPLWNVPYDMKYARELAESVMCGVVADCGVIFDENSDGNAPLRALALAADVAEPDLMTALFTQALVATNFRSEAVASEGESAPVRTSRRRRSVNG